MFTSRARTTSLFLLLAASTLSFQGHAATIFQDNFDSGKLDHTENGAQWGGANTGDDDSVQLTTERAKSGTHSLKFTFGGGATGDDAFSEQRFKPGKAYSDVWYQFDLYVPTNYYHRKDYPANNKLMAIYKDPYPGAFHILLQMTPNGDEGGSRIGWHDHTHPDTYPVSGYDFITPEDRGKWFTVTVRIKAPTTTSSNDGIVQLWKNGKQMLDVNNAVGTATVTDSMYILGWANSGFSQTTSLHIDNFIFSNTPIAAKAPTAPANLVVQ